LCLFVKGALVANLVQYCVFQQLINKTSQALIALSVLSTTTEKLVPPSGE